MASVQLSTKAVGSIVYCAENGVDVAFYVAKHNYESALNGSGRTLLVRKDCYDTRKWHSSAVNAYASSDIDSWLNGDYKAMLDPDMLKDVGTTKIKYTPGNGTNTVSTLSRSVFLLSATELGLSSGSYINTEGETLDSAVTQLLKIAYLSLTACNQWTRSPHTQYNYYVWYASSSGTAMYGNAQGTSNVSCRPAFTVASTCYVDGNDRLLSNVDPVITDVKSIAGTTQTAACTHQYKVTDIDGDTLTVKEHVDGIVTKTRTGIATGTTLTFEKISTAAGFQTLTNGNHVLMVTVSDGTATISKSWTFTKKATSVTITLSSPLTVSGAITVAALTVTGSIPSDATFKAEVTNNAKDTTPVWQDCTTEVIKGVNIVFTNKTAANGAAFNFRVTASRGSSGTSGTITGVSGTFQ